MITSRPFIVCVLIVALLSLQIGGVHLHVSAQGEGGAHGTHFHEGDLDGHDHESDSDVSLVALWSKLADFALPLVALLLVAHCGARQRLLPNGRSQPGLRTRWRPPLRGPPVSVN